MIDLEEVVQTHRRCSVQLGALQAGWRTSQIGSGLELVEEEVD